MIKTALLAFAVALALPAGLCAQDTGVDPLEVARQIRRNMIKVEDGLHEIEGEAVRAAARSIPKDMDKLIKANRMRGVQITEDIDALISTFKP